MRVIANVHVLAKVPKTWKDKDGIEHISYSANVMQNNGEIIDTIKLSKEMYDNVMNGKTYTVTADYGTGSNGGYLRITAIAEVK